jgi:hypothetical protein
MNYPALLSSLTKISLLVDRASQTALRTAQLEELRTSVESLEWWPLGDPAFERARRLAACVHVSGVLSTPSKRPTLPEQILSDCHFLIGSLGTRMQDSST